MSNCKRLALLLPLLLLWQPVVVHAQPPQRPLQALDTWSLPGYHAEDPAARLQLPEGLVYDRVSSIAFTPEGNLLVLHRGPQPLLEFDASGKFLRAFGAETGLVFAHGLDVDEAGNIWLTDLRTQLVLKLDRDGKLLLTLGTANEGGLWDEAAGARHFDQPHETGAWSGRTAGTEVRAGRQLHQAMGFTRQ
jgi:hypothetical protein